MWFCCIKIGVYVKSHGSTVDRRGHLKRCGILTHGHVYHMTSLCIYVAWPWIQDSSLNYPTIELSTLSSTTVSTRLLIIFSSFTLLNNQLTILMVPIKKILEDLVRDILDRVVCAVPRSYFAKASKQCRLVSMACNTPQQAHMLLTPMPRPTLNANECESGNTVAAFCVRCARKHNVILPGAHSSSRYVLCGFPWWVIAARLQSSDHVLQRLGSGKSISLLEFILLSGDDASSPIVIRSVALSCDPSTNNYCFVAMISTIIRHPRSSRHNLVCFSRLGHVIATNYLMGEFEDSIFYNGSFYTLSRRGHVLVTEPQDDNFLSDTNTCYPYVLVHMKCNSDIWQWDI